MKDIVQYFADLALLSTVGGAKPGALPRSLLSTTADKNATAFLQQLLLRSKQGTPLETKHFLFAMGMPQFLARLPPAHT